MTDSTAEQQFREFVHARTPALSRTAYLLTGDAHLAEDLVQTALFKAAKAWHRIEGDPEPYVRRILYTQNVSWWRQRRLKESALGSYDAPSASSASSDSDLRLTLEQALARLTTRQRTVLVLRFFEDLTEVQTAAALGIGSGTVKSIQRQALRRLRALAPELAELIGGCVMSTDELRRELDRIAETAPSADVPHDTWTRARRSVVRDRVAVAAAGFAVVATVAAGVTWLPDRLDPPVADSSALGVPDHLYFVPNRMSERDSDDGSWLRDEVEDAVTGVEVGAAAWVTYTGLPVVVDASDGDYHLLDLPDFAGNNEAFARALGTPVVALSPDGRQLAYGYAVFGPDSDTEPIPSGVRVIDLGTGKLREIPVEGAAGTAVSRIDWSPNGSWLAFAGWQHGTWTSETMGTASGDTADTGPVVGRVSPGATEAETRPITSDDGGLAVDDQGTVTWFAGGLKAWDQDGVTPGGRGNQGLKNALGTTSDGLAVRLDVDGDGPTGGVELVSADGTATRVVVIADGVPTSSLSLATDLMSSDRPTVDRPEPDWPWSEGRWWITIVFGVAAIALLMALLDWRWRRYAWRSSARKAS